MVVASMCSEPRYRLSKPRTLTSTNPSGFLETRVDFSSSLSSKQSSPGLSAGLDENMSRRQLRQSLREHLFGDESTSNMGDASDEDDSRDVTDTARAVRRRLSRSGTAISKRASLRRSLNALNRSSTTQLIDFALEPEDEQEVVSKIKQKAYRDKLASLNQPLHTTIEDDGVQETIISPIRRRSLMTPGLATRNPTDMLAKPPVPRMPVVETEDEYYYNRTLSETSPLTRLAALDLADELVHPDARSATPVDVDYGNLGGLGALRVTNGVASPIPSIRSTTSADPRDQTEYFSLPHLRHLAHRPSLLRLQEVRRSGEFADGFREYAKRQSGEISRCDSKYSASHRPSSRRGGLCHDSPAASLAPQLELQHGQVKPHLPKFRFDRTSLIAENYMLDLSDNPFTIEVSTKPNEVDDDLFEDRGWKHKSSLQDVNLYDGDNALREGGQVQDALVGSFDEPSKYGRGLRQQEIGTHGKTLHSETTKPDSGYSSGSSLRSVKQLLRDDREERNERPDSVAALSTPAVITNPSLVTLTRPQLTAMPTTTTKSSLLTWSYQNSSETIPTVLSTDTVNSEPSARSKRLQKPRPRSQPPPANRIAIQSHLDITAASFIPPVPLDIAERNARRLQDLPPLNHTLPSVDHEKVGPETKRSPPLSAPLRFPTPTLEDTSPTQGHVSRKARRSSVRRSLLASSKSQHRSSYELGTTSDYSETIATLGDVTQSLGTSPYDAAFLSQSRRTQAARTKTQGSHHQISPSMPRTKSSIGMNDYEAAEVSKMRAMYKRSSLEAPFVSSRPPSPAKPGGRQFNDRGGIPGKMPRLEPMHRDRPPLPPIPVTVQVQMRQAQLTQPLCESDGQQRPAPRKAHSMIIPPSSFDHPEQPVVDWSAPRDAWATHRRLAGEALTDASFPTGTNAQTLRPTPPSRNSLPSPRRDEPPPNRSRVDTVRTEERTSPVRCTPPPGAHETLTFAQLYEDSCATSRRSVSATAEAEQRPDNLKTPAATVAWLSGRFDGGLNYGYEPGCGVGGSAGTRTLANKASRKSVEVSKGFGLDLSDIPIFISPSY
ncbi:MAG: hypothetical protein LQ340_001437 [Diploschistes diacapsis]|nr:MAG: hypothetical protein LQ340_001437 [Diploschistes diacapsis]